MKKRQDDNGHAWKRHQGMEQSTAYHYYQCELCKCIDARDMAKDPCAPKLCLSPCRGEKK